VVVSDAGLSAAGVLERVISAVGQELPVQTWAETPTDPTFADVDRLVEFIRAAEADTVLSLGSGSVLAIGRSAAVASTHSCPSADLAGVGRTTEQPLLSVAIPTTAGSGGEVSRQATITAADGHKSGIQDWSIAARLAILDAELLASVPHRQVVASGIDALTHALEAYVSRRATPLTDALALPSFEVLFRETPLAAQQADTDRNSRMLLASSMAIMACGSAGLGLIHGLNKGLTYLFHARGYPSLPYGELHSVLLPWVCEFNLPAATRQFARLAAAMGVEQSGEEAETARLGVRKLKDWLADMGAPRRLPWTEYEHDDLDTAVSDVVGRPMALDNPRDSTREDLRHLLELCTTGW